MDINHRRSSVEVIADILRLGEAGKTEIMYSANMSYRQLQRYLAFLVQQGFLERLVANGVSSREIAQQLAVSEATVKRALQQVFEKLGVRNRSEAVAEAMRRNLI